MRKGQLLLDFLLLVLALSFVFVLITSFMGERALTAQATRYQSQIHEKTLLAVLDKEVSLNDSSGNQALAGRIADLLSIRAKHGLSASLEKGLNETIHAVINKTNANRHYIFFCEAKSGASLWLYDSQPTVCLEDIALAEYEEENYKVLYGSWFKWETPPTTC